MLNNLRLRSALGWAGSQPGIVNAYSQYITYTQLPFAGRPGFVNDVTFGNPTLRNERAREWEVGTEVGLLDGRVGLEATYYNRLVSDLLFFRPLPTSTGFSRQFFPIGSMSNKGVELLLQHDERRAARTSRGRRRSTYTRNKNLVEKPRHSGFPVGGRISEPHPRRRAGRCRSTARMRRATASRARCCSIRSAAIAAAIRPSTWARRSRSARRSAAATATTRSTRSSATRIRNGWDHSSTNSRSGKKLRLRGLLDGVFGNKIMNLSTRAQNAGIASNSKEYERELLPYGDPRKLPPGFNARTQGIFEYWVEDGTLREAPRAVGELHARYARRSPPLPRRHRPDGVGPQSVACGPTTAATTRRSICSARTPADCSPCRRRRPIAASISAATPFRACGRSARASPTNGGDQPCA